MVARISPEEIYRFARAAGFSPDQATTMTAIALAESTGNANAHNPNNEDSRGLWQINVEAHGERFGDLYDPMTNAHAAYAVSQQGGDMSPWTVTHKSGAARYLEYQDEAQAAAVANGEPGNLGVWTGVPGYGHHLPTGSPGGPAFATPLLTGDEMDDDPSFGTPGGPSAHDFVNFALAQDGDKYLWGAEAAYSDPDPDTFDCAELVEWAAAQVGVEGLGEVSYLQYSDLREQGAEMTVEEALHTPGALLFRFGTQFEDGLPTSRHVAISLGDGRTIEARGSKWGVGQFDAGDRFTHAAYIPELDYGRPMGTPMPAPMAPVLQAQSLTAATVHQTAAPDPMVAALPPDPNPLDTDGDGITDRKEIELGLDPNSSDTDGDNISDGYELAVLQTDPTRSDTDYDGLRDSTEIALGTSPTVRDSDADGKVDSDGLVDGTVDTDLDGLSDELEALIGTKLDHIDSDLDGYTDFAEFQAGSDPLDPLSNLTTLMPSVASPLPTDTFGVFGGADGTHDFAAVSVTDSSVTGSPDMGSSMRGSWTPLPDSDERSAVNDLDDD